MQMNRREFLKATLLTTGMMGVRAMGAGNSLDMEEWPSEMSEYQDEKTGARVRTLTKGPFKDQVIYQTHPMWTPEMVHLVFTSDRSGGMLPHAIEMKTGCLRCLTPKGSSDFTLARKQDILFFMNGSGVYTVSVNQVFRGVSQPVRLGDRATICENAHGLTIDADEKTLYAAACFEKEKRWGIVAFDIPSGQWHKVCEVDFKTGHVQANPFVPGQLMFCWETGGEAPQRMWAVKADGSDLRPFFKETRGEWVTHEVWWGSDRAIFTVWPYDEEHEKQPHGILSADLASGTPAVHNQYNAWHTHGSPDGKWAVGDDFDRNLWLIQISTGERRLLTQGHLTPGGTNHPHPSFTPDNKAVIFTSSLHGQDDVFLVEIPKWEILPEG